VPADEVRDLIETGDTRWIHRGAHDLMDVAPEAPTSSSGMPRGRSLYGALPAQLEQEDSFANGLRAILAVRAEHDIAVATQIDVPDVAHPGMLVMVHRLDGGDPTLEGARLQVTVLNFSDEPIAGTVHSSAFAARMSVVDTATGGEIAFVDDLLSFPIWLGAYGGVFLILTENDLHQSADDAGTTAG
jgi:hypothetical protein